MKKIHPAVQKLKVRNLSANQIAAPSGKVGQMSCYANELYRLLTWSYSANMKKTQVLQAIMVRNLSVNQIR